MYGCWAAVDGFEVWRLFCQLLVSPVLGLAATFQDVDLVSRGLLSCSLASTGEMVLILAVVLGAEWRESMALFIAVFCAILLDSFKNSKKSLNPYSGP